MAASSSFIKDELLTGGQYRRCLENPATYRHAVYRMMFLDYLVRDLLEGARRDFTEIEIRVDHFPRHLKARPIPSSSGSPRCVEIAGDAGLHRSDCMARSFRRRPERGPRGARVGALLLLGYVFAPVPNQHCGTSAHRTCRRRLRQMTADVRTDLPGAVTTWQGIGTNVDCITANINRLTMPRWYDLCSATV